MPNENHIERLMKNYERESPRVERQLSYARQVRQSWDRTPFDQQHVQDATVLQQAQELVAAQYIDEEFRRKQQLATVQVAGSNVHRLRVWAGVEPTDDARAA